MTTCYYTFVCSDDCGELYAFLTQSKGKLSLVHWFSCNDAQYRSEYMSPLLRKLGVDMKPLPSKFEAAAEALVSKEF